MRDEGFAMSWSEPNYNILALKALWLGGRVRQANRWYNVISVAGGWAPEQQSPSQVRGSVCKIKLRMPSFKSLRFTLKAWGSH